MSAPAVSGELPSWVARLDDEALSGELGPDTFRRGAAYHRSGAVTSLAADRTGRSLVAGVRGSAGRSYQTVITALDDVSHNPDEPPAWVSRCSCPMGLDCKHVVAVLLTARGRFAEARLPAARTWEAVFADLVRYRPAAPDFAPLALHLEVVPGRPARWVGSPAVPPGLRLRPVTSGKNGGWIRAGVSWRQLEYGYGEARLDPAQREPMLGLLAAARTRAGAGYYGTESFLTSEQLGPALWRLLRATVQAGVPLVTGSKGQTDVRVEQDPATVVLDIRRSGPDGGASVSARLRMPGFDDTRLAPGGGCSVLGSPPHGVLVQGPAELVLAEFDRPPDPTLSALLADGEAVHIPAPDLPRFLGEFYPTLRQRARVESSDESVCFPEILPPRLALSVRFEPGHQAVLRWSFAYTIGQQVVPVPIAGPSGGPPRDRAAEAALVAGLDVLDAVPGLRVVVGAERRLVPEQRLRGLQTAAFVCEVLPALTERDDLLVTLEGTPLPYVEVDAAPRISVSVTDPEQDGRAAPGDWFDLGITVTIAGEEVPFEPLFTALARGDGHLILGSGTWFSLDRPELVTLRRLIEEARALQDRDPGTLRITRWHAGLWDELVDLGVVTQQSERWSRLVTGLLDLTSVPTPAPPAGLRAELRDYQVAGYQWLSLLWDHKLGGILADDMGLGKTLQTLAMAARARELGSLSRESPLLVVAPTSVASTWVREAARFCPQLRVAAVTQTRKRRGEPLAEAIDGADVVVTTFALFRLDEDDYQQVTWSGLVLDEAQFVKNHQAKTYAAARRLPAPFKLAITGTPLENSLMDLWALLSIVAPGLFPSPQRFTELYRKPIESGEQPELLLRLQRRIRPLMLRRAKEEVARDLPPKVEQVLSVPLNPKHRRVYQTHLQRERQRVLGMLADVERNRIAILRSLTVLRQLSLDVSLIEPALAGTVPSSKIDMLVERLHEVTGEGHRALVFSQFTGFLRLVRERLAAEGLRSVYLDGKTRDRPRRIAEFTGGDAPVFLISLKAGGSGLTLTEADYVFVLDPWWNPATEAQAVDRTHRIGQDKTVMVYRLVAEGTIEEKVAQLQQRKRDLFARVVDGDGTMSGPLSADDIRGLLGP